MTNLVWILVPLTAVVAIGIGLFVGSFFGRWRQPPQPVPAGNQPAPPQVQPQPAVTTRRWVPSMSRWQNWTLMAIAIVLVIFYGQTILATLGLSGGGKPDTTKLPLADAGFILILVLCSIGLGTNLRGFLANKSAKGSIFLSNVTGTIGYFLLWVVIVLLWAFGPHGALEQNEIFKKDVQGYVNMLHGRKTTEERADRSRVVPTDLSKHLRKYSFVLHGGETSDKIKIGRMECLEIDNHLLALLDYEFFYRGSWMENLPKGKFPEGMRFTPKETSDSFSLKVEYYLKPDGTCV